MPITMNLIKRNPDLFDTDLMDLPSRMFSDAFFRERAFPKVNVRDLAKEFQVELAAPGYKTEDLKVEVKDDILTISSEQKQETENEQDGWRRREFSYQSFSRGFQLPENADAENVKAKFVDGVLRLSVAKKTATVPAKEKAITIQ